MNWLSQTTDNLTHFVKSPGIPCIKSRLYLRLKIFKAFPMISLSELKNTWVWQALVFGPQGYGWQDLCRRPLFFATH